MKHAISFKYRFELLIPLFDNKGYPFAPEKILSVHDKLLERFGGCRMEPLSPHIRNPLISFDQTFLSLQFLRKLKTQGQA